MQIALWIINGLLAAMFLFAGTNKVIKSPQALEQMGMAWVSRAPGWSPRIIGSIEVLGAIGLIVPMATGIAPLLTAVAAVGLSLVMVGASVVHIVGKESPVITLVLALLSTVSAALGFMIL